jgi:PAS domain-containing protein
LRDSERQFVAPFDELLEALPTAVYTTDAEGRITFFNEAAADLWGWSGFRLPCRPLITPRARSSAYQKSPATERRRAREQQNLHLREMRHRVKNLFAVASGLVTLSARSAGTPAEMAEAVRERLSALTGSRDPA